MIASLMISIALMAPAHAVEAADPTLEALVREFDRQLEVAPRGRFRLEKSAAYQKLFAYRTGDRKARFKPAKFAPGSGKSGQISGGELPKGTWAITYDDGPHKTHTEKILGVLSSYRIPATFFWTAENVVKLGQVVSAAEAAGHSVQNHSYTHADLAKASDLALGFEVSVSTQVMKDHFAASPKFFRLPYGSGSGNKRVRDKVAAEKLISVLWNADSLDWADKDPASVSERVRKQMLQLGRGIVLFHDIQAHTADASARLFKAVEKSGYRYVTLPEALEQLNKSRRH